MTAKTPSAEVITSALYTIDQVCERTTLGKSSIYELVKQGRFPKPVRLMAHASRWVRADVDAWVQSRIREAAENLEPYSTADTAK